MQSLETHYFFYLHIVLIVYSIPGNIEQMAIIFTYIEFKQTMDVLNKILL